ncbi:MAG: CBS domain-containing protein [Desulfobacterales bacterium]
MRRVIDILNEKGFQVYSISPNAHVYEALKMMADKNVGALMVMEGDTAVGLISERDYARKIVLKGKFSKEVTVREIMNADLIRIGPEEDVEGCMELMSNKRVRHLPVFEDDKLIGIISIGDLVKTIIEHKEEIIDQLESYIKGKR